jgi:hypothetical protein
MTILDDLAYRSSQTLDDWLARYQSDQDGTSGVVGRTAAPFDNRPSWDNWTKHGRRPQAQRESSRTAGRQADQRAADGSR